MFYALQQQHTMTTVPYKKNRGTLQNAMSLLSFLGENPQLRNQFLAAGNQLASVAGSALGFPRGTSQPPAPFRLVGNSNKSNRSVRNGSRSKKSRRASKTNTAASMGGKLSLSRNPALTRPRFEFVFVVPLTTLTTTGNAKGNWFPTWEDSTSTPTFSDMSSVSAVQYAKLAAPFYWQTIHRISVEYVPQCGYTVNGTAATAWYAYPGVVTTITGNQAFIEKPFSEVSDIKSGHCWNWTPQNEDDREAKVIASSSAVTGATRAKFMPGYVVWEVLTDATAAALTVGKLVFKVDLTLSGLL
jgi:hypothetical protein